MNLNDEWTMLGTGTGGLFSHFSFGSPWAMQLRASLSKRLAQGILLLALSVVGPRTLPVTWRTFWDQAMLEGCFPIIIIITTTTSVL